MLNMLTVTQMLNQKVKVEKVDPYYPFHPHARTPQLSNDETRLLMTPADAEAWVDKGLPALVAANWKEVRHGFVEWLRLNWRGQRKGGRNGGTAAIAAIETGI